MEIAKEWIKEFDYPFGDSDLSEKYMGELGLSVDGSYQLAKVAQFLAIDQEDKMFPKFHLSDYLSKIKSPDFSLLRYENTPYAFLAGLNLKIYFTTNYDLLMEKALISRGKDPVSEFCRWNDKLLEIPSRIKKHSKYSPDINNPLVFHLHGDITTPESIVLTEKDYFDFIFNLKREDEKNVLPAIIRQVTHTYARLFIGYTLEDISFYTIFQGLSLRHESILGDASVAVQIAPTINRKDAILDYLRQYAKKIFEVDVYWGDITDFVTEFQARWQPGLYRGLYRK